MAKCRWRGTVGCCTEVAAAVLPSTLRPRTSARAASAAKVLYDEPAPRSSVRAHAIVRKSSSGLESGGRELQAWLRSGVVLCQLANCLQTGLVPRVSGEEKPFKQMENIGAYLDACRKYGVPAQARQP